jgi:uncharacterized circularly permuted ATP-grasp superfamily protein
MTGDALFKQYPVASHIWDEMKDAETIRQQYLTIYDAVSKLNLQDLQQKDKLASELFMSQGITFTVYSDNEGIERIFPFDIIPRIITSGEWNHVEAGIKQRLKALNMFLKDVYNEQQIIKDGVIPAALVSSCPHFTREVFGIQVPHDIYVHIAGIDLIRGDDGTFYILEDNLRTPSGVSYMMENREVTKRIFPDLLATSNVRMINNYPLILHDNLVALASRQTENPVVVLLTQLIMNILFLPGKWVSS